jgi:hypothetical protein
MKLLVYSDLQATDGSDLCYETPGMPLQHYRVSKVFDDIVAVYKKYGCDGIVDLGDTTDDRSAIPVTTIDVLCAGLAKLPASATGHHKLTGNHEQFLRDTSISNWRLFAPYFEVIQDRKIVTVDNCKIFFCSYPKDYAELASWIALESSKARGHKILFGHFQVKGAYLNSTKAATGIPVESINGFDLAVLGHVHTPQSVTDRVHYVGSPFQQDWGEINQKKRLAIVDTSKFTVTWVELEGYPIYREVSLKEFKTAVNERSEDRYRVVLNSHAEAEQFFAHPFFNRAVGVYNYETEGNNNQVPEPKDWSFEGTIRRYVEVTGIPEVGLTPDEMLTMGRMIVNKS